MTSSANPRFLVLGAAGLFGRHICRTLALSGRVFVALDHRELDITDRAAALAALERHAPDVVVNCAALCSFDGCEQHPELSAAVNRDAPIWWADQLGKTGVRFVHFSTDYLFDGAQRRPYVETDAPHPMSVYARHKSETEPRVVAHEGHLLVRVAWLFGAGGRTFMSLLPNLLMEQEEVRVASGKRGSCLHAGLGAEMLIRLIDQEADGLVHMVHSGEASWEGFASACIEQLKARGLTPRCERIVRVPYQSMPALSGFRPAYSVLATERYAGLVGDPPHWKEGLERFLDDGFPPA